MKIKQQKQIKVFLIEQYGNDRGIALFEKQEKILGTLIENTKDKSENQMKTLTQTILPRIALYKALFIAVTSAFVALAIFPTSTPNKVAFCLPAAAL